MTLVLLALISLTHHSPPDLPSFPTRRSSDLPHLPLLPLRQHELERRAIALQGHDPIPERPRAPVHEVDPPSPRRREPSFVQRDRKSTRLNSSHGYISYAVFCLKKKKQNTRL